MGIGCISHHDTVFLRCKFSRIVVLAELDNLFLFHFHILFALAHRHLHPTILNYIIGAQIFLLFLSFLFLDRFKNFIIWFLRRRLLNRFIILRGQVLFEGVESVLQNGWLIFDKLVRILYTALLLVLLS